MNIMTGKFMTWLMGLTRIMRYLVIAILFHVVLLVVLGSIKIVAIVPSIVARLTAVAPPPLDDTLPDDPYAVYRDFDYAGETLGGGGGLGGKGPGGVPTAGGAQAAILAGDANKNENPVVEEVISVFSSEATSITRPEATPGGSGMVGMSGMGDTAGGTAGIKGPGGPWLGAGRMGPQRSVNLAKFGGSAATERAVMAALRWLKENQKPDGSWPIGGHVSGGTALGLLCFLGHGENADSAEFGSTVQKALQLLVKRVSVNGDVAGSMYEQGLVTLALAEGFLLTSSPELKEPLQKATAFILDSQKTAKTNPLHKGGWRYSPKDPTSDVSVSGWVFMGLKSAKSAGMEVPEDAMKLAEQYFWNMYAEQGGFGYDGPGASPALTPAGAFCIQLLGSGKDKRIKKVLDNLKNTKFDWETDGGWAMYRCYYTTMAMFQGAGHGAEYWDYWNKQMREALLKNQAEDGHWSVPPKSSETSYAKEPVYPTCLATLMLEVYYRYLPMYQLIDKPVPAGPGGPGGPAPGAVPTAPPSITPRAAG